MSAWDALSSRPRPRLTLAAPPACLISRASHRTPPHPTRHPTGTPAEGIEALATTRVVIRPAGKMSGEGYVTSTQGGLTQRSFSGSGADEDIVVSSARAYVR